MLLPAQYAWFEPVLIATIVVSALDRLGILSPQRILDGLEHCRRLNTGRCTRLDDVQHPPQRGPCFRLKIARRLLLHRYENVFRQDLRNNPHVGQHAHPYRTAAGASINQHEISRRAPRLRG
jgi:hypothetical protein